jgi:hypothetical protein
MAPVTWMTVFVLPALVTAANKTGPNTIPVHTVAKVVNSIYHQLHSKFVILLHESAKSEGRKYLDVPCNIVLTDSFITLSQTITCNASNEMEV